MATLKRYRTVVFDSARWEGFAFREGDILIATPPKSGTTWMQMICALFVIQDPGRVNSIDALSPWLDMQTRSLEEVVALLAAQEHRRFIKTHTPLDGLPWDDRVTYISVGRDPRDAAISFANHADNVDTTCSSTPTGGVTPSAWPRWPHPTSLTGCTPGRPGAPEGQSPSKRTAGCARVFTLREKTSGRA